MTQVVTREVEAVDDGLRLDRWFKRHYPHLNFGALAKMCRTGQVRVDGKRVDPGKRIAAGSQIRVPPIKDKPKDFEKSPQTLSEEDIAFVQSLVLHRDDHIIALNKPPGLPSQGGPGITRHVDMLLDGLRFDASERPRLVHRLDKDTSGVMLLGCSASAAAKLAAAFRERDTEKIYWALVVGVPEHAAGRIDMALDKRPGPAGDKVKAVEDGKAARTDYRVVEAVGKRCAWLALSPRTGRTHQLRVHCAEALKCPIVGDGKYGGKEAYLTGNVSRKLHLHARRITFTHPNGQVLTLRAPLARHMAESWALFGFDEAAGDDVQLRRR